MASLLLHQWVKHVALDDKWKTANLCNYFFDKISTNKNKSAASEVILTVVGKDVRREEKRHVQT